ncbi:MAG: RES family NAD+ phosphorylase [Flavobacteriaceae bacterium]
MLVYRIGKTQFIQDLEGVGAKLYGGRWNHIGTPCIYTSESRALAVLEYLVNVTIQHIPKQLSIATFKIDEKQLETPLLKNLPEDWQSIPASYTTKNFGTEILQKGVPGFKIPSVVIPDEYNYVLNPLVVGRFFKLVEVKEFVYDVRL